MPLLTCSLNSGSNGNCYYIGTDSDAILVDAGLSCRETERRLRRCDLSIHAVKAIFVSHEHTDHIRGVEKISEKYQIPVYITNPTLRNGRLNLSPSLKKAFKENEPVSISKLEVTAFKKYHDAADPHSFIVRYNQIKVGIFTDIGRVCEKLKKHFRQCNVAFLESNYDELMLEEGRYPKHLKERIRGGNGHLSNTQALNLFLHHRNKNLTHLFLSHLSQENNSPQKVKRLFDIHSNGTEIIVASRYEPTEVIEIVLNSNRKTVETITLRKGIQLSLF